MLRLACTPGSSYCRRLPGCTSTAPAPRPKISFAAYAPLPARPRLCICSASRSNRLPPRLRVALQLISSSHRLPPRLRVALTYRHASASLCLAVARAPLLMHLVIHLVRQVESHPLPPEAADAEISSRDPVVVVVLRLLRPYLCVLAPALAAPAPLSGRPGPCHRAAAPLLQARRRSASWNKRNKRTSSPSKE